MYPILFMCCAIVAGQGGVFSQDQDTLTWQDCVLEAGKNNPDLISAVESLNQKKASQSVTSSSLFPQVTGNLNYANNGGSSTSAESYSYGADVSQLIFDGFKTVNKVNAAKENVKAAQYNVTYVSSAVRQRLRNAFIDLLTAQELISVLRDIIKIRKDNLILMTLRFHSGLEHKGVLLTAEANLSAAEYDLSQARRDITVVQRQLSAEMGRSIFKPIVVQGDFDVRYPETEKPDFEKISEVNASYLQQVAKKNAAAFDIKSAYAGFSPTINGSSGIDRRGSNWPPRTEQWNTGISLSVPIFEGGLQQSQVSQATAAYNQSVADTRGLKDSLIVSLEQTWSSLQDAVEYVGVQQKSLEAVQERYKIASSQYATGFITYDNLIIIENDLVNAKKSFLQARANALRSEAAWIQAKGETLEYVE